MKVLHLEKDLGHCLEKDDMAPKKSSRQSNWGTKPIGKWHGTKDDINKGRHTKSFF